MVGLCEIKIIVFLPFIFKTESINLFSVSESRLTVDSSSTKYLYFYKEHAIPILCCWPPDNFDPPSPRIVSKPSGKELKKFSSWRVANG